MNQPPPYMTFLDSRGRVLPAWYTFLQNLSSQIQVVTVAQAIQLPPVFIMDADPGEDGIPGPQGVPGPAGQMGPAIALSIDSEAADEGIPAAPGSPPFNGFHPLMMLSGLLSLPVSALVTGTTYTVASSDVVVHFNLSAGCTVTMPTASAYPGRVLFFHSYAAFALTSASSNVIPLASTTAGTAILTASAGASGAFQSDGSNWRRFL